LSLVSSDKSSKDLVRQYFNILISEFEAKDCVCLKAILKQAYLYKDLQ